MVKLFSNTFAATVEPSSKFIIELIHPPLTHFRIISLDPHYLYTIPPNVEFSRREAEMSKGAILSQSGTLPTAPAEGKVDAEERRPFWVKAGAGGVRGRGAHLTEEKCEHLRAPAQPTLLN